MTVVAEHALLFDQHPDPLWIIDRKTLRFLAVNDAALECYGYGRDAFLAMTLADLAAVSGSTPVLRGPVLHRTGDGQVIDVELLSHSEVAPSRSQLMMLARVRQCAHPERAAVAMAELQEAQVNLRTAQRLLQLAIWKMDLGTRTLSWSSEASSIYGLAPGDFDGSYAQYLALVHPEDREAMQSTFEDFAVSSAKDLGFEHRVARPDGSIVTVRGLGERTNSNGRPQIVGVVQNITDQRRDQVLLDEANHLLRMAGRAAQLGAWRVGVGAESVWWSDETARIHGEPAGTQPSKTSGIDYYAPEDQDRFRKALDASLREGQAFDETLQIVTRQGERRVVRAVGEPERDTEGRIISVRGAFQDISELVAAREASVSMAGRLSQTLAHMSDAFYLLDQDLRVVYLNQRAGKILNTATGEVLGQRTVAGVDDLAGMLKRAYDIALETGQPQTFEHFLDTSGLWYQVNCHPVPEGLAVYFRDITQARERDQQLRLLDAAVSRSNDVLLITDAADDAGPGDPKIVYVNQAFSRLTGYSAEEVIGKSPRLLQGPKTQRGELDRIRAALERWEPVRAELINYTKSGQEFWLEMDIVPLANDSGWYTHWVAIERDVTERKRTEAAHRELSERVELIAQASEDLIWDWDQRSDLIWWNRSFSRVFGFEPAQSPTSLDVWRQVVHPDDQARVTDGLVKALNGDARHWEDEYRFIRADGAERIAVDRGYIIRDSEGKALRMLGSIVDVTERRELDERLRQAMKMEAIGQLTGGIAHDFNNLLTVILGNSELLHLRLEGQTDLQAYAEMTATAAQRGAEMTQRLLAFARRQVLNPQVIQVNELLQQMEQLLRRSLGEAIDIQLELKEGLWLTEVDPGQLETVVLNLCINARDAMPNGGRLRLATRNLGTLDDGVSPPSRDLPGPCLRISVIDTGCGMSPEVLRRAFDPFFTTKDVGRGSGLGLSMAYGFASQSGGAVQIDSRLGRGTAVHLYLPRTLMAAPPSEPEASQSVVVGGPEKILLVEDNDLVGQHVAGQLAEMGYGVVRASQATEALVRLMQQPDIDLMLSDVVMPGGMNGQALADLARTRNSKLKILLTSGYADENCGVPSPQASAVYPLLRKPYRRQDLAHKLRQILEADA